jgi:undecaprenyl-diphosphatase
MSFILILKTIILGVIEGLTEYLPVSSTGHLIIFAEILNFNEVPEKIFEITIQLGAILAICVIYYKKFYNILITLHNDKDSQKFVLNFIIAIIPAIIIGYFAHDFIKAILFSTTIVASSLIIGGIIMIVIDKINFEKKYYFIEKIPKNIALKIGLFQCLAMVPGTSRSGATIIGGVYLGLSKKAATEFSFFLAIPTILGATIFDIVNNGDIFFDYLSLIIIGFITAFLSALLIVVKFVEFIRRFGFAPFGYYRIAVGTVILLYFW